MTQITRRCILGTGLSLLLPPTGSAANESGSTVQVSGNKLLRGNREFRAIGCNFYDALNHRDMRRQFAFLKENGVPFIRMDIGTYGVGNNPGQGWRQYLSNKVAWYAVRDRCVEAAEAVGLGLVTSMFWRFETLSELMQFAYGSRDRLADLGRSDSNTRRFMRDVTAEMVARYKHSPAIWGWECSNELSNEVILGCNGVAAYATAESRVTFAGLADMYSDWARVVRSVDTSNRMLSTGDNLADHDVFTCASGVRLRPDTLNEWMNVPVAGRTAPAPLVINPPEFNSLSVHVYQHANVPGHWFRGGPQVGPAGLIKLYKQIADANNRIVFIGEFGSLAGRYGQDGRNGTDGTKDGERRYYQATLDAILDAKIQLAAAWNYGYQPKTPTRDWNIDVGTDREYVFRSIAEANARIQRDLDTPAP